MPKEDALTRILGADQPGIMRGAGFGVTSKTLKMHQQNSAWTKSIHKELKDLKEWKKQMEDMIK